MKVFLSWSGSRSHLLAQALRDWLPGVLQSVQPWLSSQDIQAGERWSDALAKALEEARVTVVCLTRDGLESSWLQFEVGALSNSAAHSRVCMYSFGVPPTEIRGPLSQFQVVQADRAGTLDLLRSINSASNDMLPEHTLNRVFQLWWPQLEAALAAIPGFSEERAPQSVVEKKLDQAIAMLEQLVGRNSPEATPPGRRTAKATQRSRPRAFIGSSTTGLPIAYAIQQLLDPVSECTIWNQAVFNPSETIIESLVNATRVYDFAIVILTPDDTATVGGISKPAPRGNLLFELGLFAGALGRARTFLVVPAEAALPLPSDLSGVTTAQFRPRADGNLVAALGPAVFQIMQAMGIERVFGAGGTPASSSI